MPPCIICHNPTASGADDNRDLAFIIQLFGFRRPDQIIIMPDECRRKANEQRRVRRCRLSILIFRIAVREIDPDTDDLGGGFQRCVQRYFIACQPYRSRRVEQGIQRPGICGITEAGKSDLEAICQIGNGIAIHPAKTGRAVWIILA